MTRRRRFLKIAKWTATVMFVLSLAAWVCAANASIGYHLGDSNIYFGLSDGELRLVVINLPIPRHAVRWDWTGASAWCSGEFSYVMRNGEGAAQIPAWVPVVIALLTASAFFMLDRRRTLKPGHCCCAYNLTGNVSGVCPECGTPTEAKA